MKNIRLGHKKLLCGSNYQQKQNGTVQKPLATFCDDSHQDQ
ncbi:hypothetical protein UUU_44500 [Klebsiella pneumoniae subsp. pneumoniae DSM 30104 = JCM 1662 = NBRC 14940]|nr:hypothetical protein UUU_44500 [Klebsiella pneumoniae subsp. pneumoniae DSM 30104 = JCM 1662 = NBRC 14940]